MLSGKTPVRLSRIVLVAAWIAVLACLFLNAVRRVGGDTGDFVHFYEAARAMVRGEDVYASGRGGYIYPPLLAFLYTPLALLPQNPAAVILLVCNTALLLGSVFLAVREFARRFGVPADGWKTAAVALAAVLLVADKLKGELQMWQTNLLMLLLFTAALRLLDRRPALAGMALGLAFNIKYLPIVFLPYLLLRRRWTAAGAFAASAVGFALLPAVLTGWDVNLHYQAVAYSGLFRLMGVPVGAAPAANIDGITAEFSVSIPSGMARLAGAGGSAGDRAGRRRPPRAGRRRRRRLDVPAERRAVLLPAGRAARRRPPHQRRRRSGMGGSGDGRPRVQPADQHAPPLPVAPGANARRRAAAVAAAGRVAPAVGVRDAAAGAGPHLPARHAGLRRTGGRLVRGALEVCAWSAAPAGARWPCSAR